VDDVTSEIENNFRDSQPSQRGRKIFHISKSFNVILF
jgi:hypothetical protein